MVKITESLRIIVVAILILSIFLVAGKVMEKRDYTEDQLDNFIKSVTMEKSLNFFSKIKSVLEGHECIKMSFSGMYKKEVYYSINKSGIIQSTECKKDIVLTFNDHSISGILYGSYNLNGAILSEIATGNLKIEGVGMGDFLKAL